MFVIAVIPLSRNTGLDTLSYYSSIEYPSGTIITVPVRKQSVSGVVISCESVSTAKTALRAATFTLRKLAPQRNTPTLPPKLLATANKVADTIGTNTGAILFSLLPPDIRTGARPYPYVSDYHNEEDPTPQILTATTNDRYLGYRSHIRETFAHRGSVLFVVPNSASVHIAKKRLEQGIEKRVITFCSTHTKKQLADAYEIFTDLTTAKLIIVTPNYAFLDRHDILSIIVENASSSHYKARIRPYLDTRDVLRTYAKETKRSIVMGDTLPRTEEEYFRREEIYQTSGEHPKRHSFSSRFSVAKHKERTEKNEFAIFTDELKAAVARTAANKERTFLLAARRGIAPLVICFDCSYVFRCPDSGAPYTLIEKTNNSGESERFFYSSTSGKRVRAADTCPECGSWRLRQQGIGIQQVAEAARREFKDQPVIVFDHTTASTHTKAKRLIKEFYSHKSSILIGTTMVLPYLEESVALTCVISYEATRAIPSWRAEELVLDQLFTLRERSSSECIVQTRSETDELLKHAKRGAVDEFYDEEIAMRQILSYPPLSIFVHLTWQGDKAQVLALEEEIQKALGYIDMQCYNSPQSTEKIIRHALIRVSKSDWPDQQLVTRLRTLPPMIRIEISPERII